ncbi:MAG: erythromycin esterase family protein [Nocardioides sp.]|uniref:erythromycin esterase family protein n=1 Tax=Nocardioides sp. TaxID=35761 RepID=UPI0039E4DF23
MPTPRPDGAFAALVNDLAERSRILGWSEGIHLRTEYLTVRDAVIRQLVERDLIRVIAAESNFAASRATDAYLRGEQAATPSVAAICGVWSWAGRPLAANRSLLAWLRAVNATRPPAARVRFYGLDMYGAPPDLAPVPEEDRAHAERLRRWRGEHEAAGGDHRDLAVRDDAQFASLTEVAARHPEDRILVFEQTGHLDPRAHGSLGARLRSGELGPVRLVGALWRDGDPTVRFPLGEYAPLSHWLEDHPERLLPAPAGTGVLDLREPAEVDLLRETATAFDAVLYAPRLSIAEG